MPHHALQQRQCVPACLGTRSSRCGCCRCHRGKWKRHSSMTLLHKTVQDCTTKAVQHALATLRLLFRACSSSPPTLTSDLICFQAAQCHSKPVLARHLPNPPLLKASQPRRLGREHPEPQQQCAGLNQEGTVVDTPFSFESSIAQSEEACLLLAKSSSGCGWLSWVGSQKVKICYSNQYPHN